MLCKITRKRKDKEEKEKETKKSTKAKKQKASKVYFRLPSLFFGVHLYVVFLVVFLYKVHLQPLVQQLNPCICCYKVWSNVLKIC